MSRAFTGFVSGGVAMAVVDGTAWGANCDPAVARGQLPVVSGERHHPQAERMLDVVPG